MSFSFSLLKVTNVILFIVKSLGGKADIRKLYLLLYFADKAHLSCHGSPITGDVYVAMKYGPVPLNVLNLCRELGKAPLKRMVNGKIRTLLSVDSRQYTIAHTDFDMSYLSSSEVACLFDVVHELKDTPLDVLFNMAKKKAWNDADLHGVMDPADMAAENGATVDIIEYIRVCHVDEMKLFDPNEQEGEEK